jgi:hypothetical protein
MLNNIMRYHSFINYIGWILMKFLLTALLLTISINSFSQEERSPRFSCTETESGEKYFVLVGNEFPQIPDLDYSSQLQLVEQKYYFDGTAALYDIFTIKSISKNSFETEVMSMENQGIDLGDISLKMDESGKLVQTFIMPDEHSDFLGIEDTTMTIEFNCKPF